MKQKKASDTELQISVSSQIEASLRAKKVPNVFYEVSMPEGSIEFRCEDNASFVFKLDQGQYRNLPTEIMYTPQRIDSNRLYLWTKNFNLPYTIATVVYATSPQTIYMVYNDTAKTDDDQYVLEVLDQFSKTNMTYAYSASDVTEKIKKYKNHKVICFTDTGACKTSANGIKNYIIITPNPGTGLNSYGIVNFSSNPAEGVPYIGDAILYGAIFAENKAMYECQSSRLFKQAEMKRILMEKRIELLEKGYTISNGCSPLLAGALYEIRNTSGSLAKLPELFNPQTPPPSDPSREKKIYNSANSFTYANEDLKLASCAQLY